MASTQDKEQYPSTKLQIILAQSLIDDFPLLLSALSTAFKVPQETIILQAAAQGSVRLLISVPTSAVDLTQFANVFSLANGKYEVLSIEAFDFLDPADQATWNLITTEYPPYRENGKLYPVIRWNEAREKAGELPLQTLSTFAKPVVPNHWLADPDNQQQLFAMSQEMIELLAPSEVETLDESLFTQYVEPAQRGRVYTAAQAAQTFGLGGGSDKAFLVLSVLVTTFNLVLAQQSLRILSDIKNKEDVRRQLQIDLKRNGVSPQASQRFLAAADEVVFGNLNDSYTPLEHGLMQLKQQLGQHLELLTYEHRLRENIRQARRFGDTEERSEKRVQIVERLNHLSLTTLGQSFNDLMK